LPGKILFIADSSTEQQQVAHAFNLVYADPSADDRGTTKWSLDRKHENINLTTTTTK
jgi:hypothetical protein